MCWGLGIKHPDYLEEELNQEQLMGWLAWLSKEPRGEDRFDKYVAYLRWEIRQAFGTRSKASPADLLPKFRTIHEPRTEAGKEASAVLDQPFKPDW